jgi:hypothetical protein
MRDIAFRKRMDRTAFLLLIAVAAPLHSAFAVTVTTADLYSMCGKSDDNSQVACKFYILGAAEGAEISWMSGQRRALFCIPNGVTSVSLAHAFTQSVAVQSVDRPDVGGVSAVASVLYALEHSYPCDTSPEQSASGQGIH